MNFRDLVNEVLLTEAAPAFKTNGWFNKVITKFNTATGSTDKPDAIPAGTPLAAAFNTGIQTNPSIPVGTVPISYIPILDLVKLLTVVGKVPAPTVDAFINNTQGAYKNTKGQVFKIIENWLKSDPTNYTPQYKSVIDYKRKTEDSIDELSKVALETYNNDSIFKTVLEIVRKRTSVFDRISHLRNPVKPFDLLIRDILTNPEPYTSGTKKVTADFAKIVDQLYITELFKIGILTKKFYNAIVAPTPAGGTPPPIVTNDYNAFLDNKNKGYSIKEISEMEQPEALNLIAALRGIAQHTREKAGRGERLQQGVAAANAIAGFAGAKLYG